jgi:hypothetical protein
MSDAKHIEVGRIKSDGYYITVIRDGKEQQLFYHDAVFLNDIVRVGQNDIDLEFTNSKIFTLKADSEVLIDDYFVSDVTADETQDTQESDNSTTDSVDDKESHPYYVKSHSISDTYAHDDSNIVDINARVSDIRDDGVKRDVFIDMEDETKNAENYAHLNDPITLDVHTSTPVSPTIGRESPTSVTTQGTSQAIASPITLGTPSPQDDSVDISKAAIIDGTSSRRPGR